jgi:hypothetical protein
MEIHEFTIRSLMVRVGMTYEGSYSLMRRMRIKGLVKELGITKVGAKNAKLYGLLMTPEQFLHEERNKIKSPPPPVSFFSNPFNLREALDLRYNRELMYG